MVQRKIAHMWRNRLNLEIPVPIFHWTIIVGGRVEDLQPFVSWWLATKDEVSFWCYHQATRFLYTYDISVSVASSASLLRPWLARRALQQVISRCGELYKTGWLSFTNWLICGLVGGLLFHQPWQPTKYWLMCYPVSLIWIYYGLLFADH